MTRKVQMLWCDECDVRLEEHPCPVCRGPAREYEVPVERTLQAPMRSIESVEVRDNGVWDVTTRCEPRPHSFRLGPLRGVSPDDVEEIGCPVCATEEAKREQPRSNLH